MNILLPEKRSNQRETLQECIGRGGYLAFRSSFQSEPSQLVAAVVASGLQGRGGAAFPAGRKWQLLRGSPFERCLVVNGGEDEPGSRKDRFLMDYFPHLVLEGALLSARAICASQVFFYINEKFECSQGSLKRALQEAEDERLIDRASLRIVIVNAPSAYVAGEDTALLEVLEGKPPIPRKKPPYPVEYGYEGRPTLIHNVETIANIPFIIREGAESYRRIGTPASPGTMLFYLDEEFSRPGIYELPFGTPLRFLVEDLGGGLSHGRSFRAILPGGPSTAFLPASALSLRMEHKAFQENGSSLGCGNLRLIPSDACMVKVTLEIAEFFARESCGKCPQCRMETNTFAVALRKILSGAANLGILEQIERLAAFSRGKGDCSLIHMAAAPVLSALKLFKTDFECHLNSGTCERCARHDRVTTAGN
ncbi:MAG: SLBB domain-containing protein [Acidobacteria bacterium]|nr:SLBB domain-containing protein [Acidobacteriota bacterium]